MLIESGSNIVILISERVGDAIFCTPAIALLKQHYPHCKITLIALAQSSAEVFNFNPAIDQVLIAPRLPAFKDLIASHDLLIDLHHSEQTMAYVKHWPKAAYLSPRIGHQHQSEVALQFIQNLLAINPTHFASHYRLYPQSQHFAKAQALLAEAGIQLDQQPLLIGCHMGCYKTANRLQKLWKKKFASHKTWPVHAFAKLQTLLYEAYPQAKLILTGVPSEQALLKYLHPLPNICNLIGKTSILEMAALMSYLTVFLTADTGPLHIAASTKTPIVALFGPTNPHLTGPKPQQAWQQVIYHNPLHEIQAEQVLAALKIPLEAANLP